MAKHKTYSISDLRDRPQFAADVADRIWKAWWRADGHELAYIRGLVDENFVSSGIPLALVAHDGGVFLGTASVIESDMEARPQYAPWVAAVWVDEAHRKSGIGAALVRAAAEAGFAKGIDTIYLCAKPAVSTFYEQMGWQRLEEGVEGLNIFAMKRAG